MGEGTVSIAAIGLVGTILALVVTPLFKLLNANTKAQEKNTEAFQSLVAETKKGNDEAAQRNGHLGEQNIQITDMIAKHTEVMSKEFAKIGRDLKKQTVKEQTVEHQTVKE